MIKWRKETVLGAEFEWVESRDSSRLFSTDRDRFCVMIRDFGG